jgi:hypothetical protein
MTEAKYPSIPFAMRSKTPEERTLQFVDALLQQP